MVQVSYPGVYVVEESSGVHTITGVATSVAAFVGFTRKGVPDKAVMVTSFADFERSYGGLDRDSPLSYAVRQFFMNGGTQALIVRVAAGASAAAWTPLQDAGSTPVLDVTASNPGAWGNSLRLSVDTTNVLNPDSDFNLVVSQLQSDGLTVLPIETHRNLSMDSHSSQYVVSVVNNASAAIRCSVPSLTFNQHGFAVSGAVTGAIAAPSNLTIGGTINGITPFILTLPPPSGGQWADMTALVAAVGTAITGSPFAASLQASESGPDGTAGTHSLKLESTTPGQSSSVVIATGASGGLARAIKMGFANQGREFTGAAQHRPAATTNPVLPTAGADGTRGTAANLVGVAANKSGIYALLDVDLFNLLVIPETYDMSDSQFGGLLPPAIELCEQRRAFYIVDPPSSHTLANIGALFTGALRSRNAATYFPALRIADPLDSMRLRAIAPSGTLAGVYARTDSTRGVWKAPAGTEATLSGVLELTSPVNDIENGLLNPLAINVLRNFPIYGCVSWGARTLKGADAQGDEYKYIPIRRLALFIEESLYRGTQWVVFEPNDEPLWAQIRLNVGVFMNGLFRQGAFQGATRQEAFFVKCDKETTTEADRNLGIVNIIVGFAPLKPAEFVIIHIRQIVGDLN